MFNPEYEFKLLDNLISFIDTPTDVAAKNFVPYLVNAATNAGCKFSPSGQDKIMSFAANPTLEGQLEICNDALALLAANNPHPEILRRIGYFKKILDKSLALQKKVRATGNISKKEVQTLYNDFFATAQEATEELGLPPHKIATIHEFNRWTKAWLDSYFLEYKFALNITAINMFQTVTVFLTGIAGLIVTNGLLSLPRSFMQVSKTGAVIRNPIIITEAGVKTMEFLKTCTYIVVGCSLYGSAVSIYMMSIWKNWRHDSVQLIPLRDHLGEVLRLAILDQEPLALSRDRKIKPREIDIPRELQFSVAQAQNLCAKISSIIEHEDAPVQVNSLANLISDILNDEQGFLNETEKKSIRKLLKNDSPDARLEISKIFVKAARKLGVDPKSTQFNIISAVMDASDDFADYLRNHRNLNLQVFKDKVENFFADVENALKDEIQKKTVSPELMQALLMAQKAIHDNIDNYMPTNEVYKLSRNRILFDVVNIIITIPILIVGVMILPASLPAAVGFPITAALASIGPLLIATSVFDIIASMHRMALEIPRFRKTYSNNSPKALLSKTNEALLYIMKSIPKAKINSDLTKPEQTKLPIQKRVYLLSQNGRTSAEHYKQIKADVKLEQHLDLALENSTVAVANLIKLAKQEADEPILKALQKAQDHLSKLASSKKPDLEKLTELVGIGREIARIVTPFTAKNVFTKDQKESLSTELFKERIKIGSEDYYDSLGKNTSSLIVKPLQDLCSKAQEYLKDQAGSNAAQTQLAQLQDALKKADKTITRSYESRHQRF